MSTGSLSVAYINTLLEAATLQQCDRSQLLEGLGMDESIFQKLSNRIPLKQCLQLFQLVTQQTENPYFGLDMGELVKPGTFRALGYAGMNCSTLGDAVMLIPKYEPLVLDVGVTAIDIGEEISHISWTPLVNDDPAMRHLIDAILSGWIHYARWLIKQEAQLLKATYTGPPPADMTEYARVFQCPVSFSQPENALFFQSHLLNRPMPQADPEMLHLMIEHAQRSLAAITDSSEFRFKVLEKLKKMLPHGAPRVSLISQELAMSERTLHRRLKSEGTTFQQLLSQARKELAMFYLKSSSLSLIEIAFLLGYTEQSSLTHAFKLWVGESPLSYRRKYRNASA